MRAKVENIEHRIQPRGSVRPSPVARNARRCGPFLGWVISLCVIHRMLPYAHRGSGSASVFVFVRQFQGDEIARAAQAAGLDAAESPRRTPVKRA
jgi:hypothetical protein